MEGEDRLPRSRAEAIGAGLKKYFTGKPCKWGHVSPRYVTGGCCECTITKATQAYWKNPEAKSAYDRQRYRANPSAKAGISDWRKRNPDKAKAVSLQWRVDNPEKHRASQRAWARRNPEKVQSNVRARRARRRNANGRHTEDDVNAILSRQKFQCAECGKFIKKRSSRQVDHIVPLKLGGTNWPSNLQVLCVTCNKVKGAKDPLKFARERGRLL